MKVILLLLSVALCLFPSCIDIMSEGGPPPYYDPEKAGAEIVSMYDLSKITGYYTYKDPFYMSEDDNKILLNTYGKIYIIDRNSWAKIKEILFNIKNFYSNIKYSYPERIVVFKNKIIFIYLLRFNDDSYKRAFFETDFDGTVIKEKDLSGDFNINTSPWTGKIGYNKLKDKIWIEEIRGENLIICEYDLTNDKFIKSSEFNIYSSIYSNYFTCYYINGDIIWKCNIIYGYPYYDTSLITKINKNNPKEPLKKIYCYYLGLSSQEKVKDLFYQDPYLWILFRRDGKMQLLKLKPL